MTTRLGMNLGLTALLAALLSGCVQSTVRWDSTFGNSARAAVAAQPINPAAVRNTDPVSGIDGKAALVAQEKYLVRHGVPEQAAPLVTGK